MSDRERGAVDPRGLIDRHLERRAGVAGEAALRRRVQQLARAPLPAPAAVAPPRLVRTGDRDAGQNSAATFVVDAILVPPATLAAGGRVTVWASGAFSTGGPNVNFYLGLRLADAAGAALATLVDILAAFPGGAQNRAFEVRAWVTCRAPGAAGVVVAALRLEEQTGGGTTAGSWFDGGRDAEWDTTATRRLELIGQFSAADAGNRMVTKQCVMQVVP
jgi:hypothetical protein